MNTQPVRANESVSVSRRRAYPVYECRVLGGPSLNSWQRGCYCWSQSLLTDPYVYGPSPLNIGTNRGETTPWDYPTGSHCWCHHVLCSSRSRLKFSNGEVTVLSELLVIDRLPFSLSLGNHACESIISKSHPSRAAIRRLGHRCARCRFQAPANTAG